MPSKSKRIGVRVHPKTWEALSAAAAIEGRTPSDLARFWIELELGLNTEAGQKPGKSRQKARPAKSSSTKAPKKTRKARSDT